MTLWRRGLFLADEDVNWSSGEVPALANLVLEEALIGFLDVLRQVGVENKRGDARVGKLGTILDLDVLALHGGWGIGFDEGKHLLIELRCSACILELKEIV